MRILLLDDADGRRAALAASLRADGYDVVERGTGRAVSDTVAGSSADLVLLHEEARGGTGPALCTELRALDYVRDTPIILLAGSAGNEASVVRGLLAGADDYVSAGRLAELRARIAVQLRNKRYRDALGRVRGEREVFRHAASVDALTSLPNRGALEGALREKVDGGEPFAVLFVDLDHFKTINDRFGHSAGDEVLRSVAHTLAAAMRAGDWCGRYGGEEFVVLLARVGEKAARGVAERLREAVTRLSFPLDGEERRITASVGVAVFEPQNPVPLADLVHRADQAMYEAKRRGRNLVVCDGEPLPSATGP